MNGKSKYWTFEMYEDSRPENWKKIIEKWMIPVAISPRHDKDIKDDGSKKKPHYHCIIQYPNTTTYKTIVEMVKPLGCNEYVEPVRSIKGMYDYLTHKNNPEKAQYDESEIELIGGFNIDNIIGFTESEIEEMKRTIINIARENKIMEYKQLYDYFNDLELYQMCNVISHATIFFNAYLRSYSEIEKRKAELENKRKLV